MKMKSALRQKNLQRYWLMTTDPANAALRLRFVKRGSKPSVRKAIAILATRHPRRVPVKI